MEQTEAQRDPELVRHAMRHWVTGVTIVTSAFNGERHGMTVSSFISVSLYPPLVLVSLETGARTLEMVQQSGVFGVTLLNNDQQFISERFAGRQTEFMDRFEDLEVYTLETGVPLLAGGMASFDCSVESAFEAGSHTIIIGKVLAVRISHEKKPLVYFDRAYRHLCD